jgi:hypothetical protein
MGPKGQLRPIMSVHMFSSQMIYMFLHVFGESTESQKIHYLLTCIFDDYILVTGDQGLSMPCISDL